MRTSGAFFFEPLTVTETDAAAVSKAATRLAAASRERQAVTIEIQGDTATSVSLPPAAVDVMIKILSAMAEGQPVSFVPKQAEMTTGEAADFLNVSRPFICKLIDAGKLPARKVNRHRRIRFDDLLIFERASQKERMAALAALAEIDRDLGLE